MVCYAEKGRDDGRCKIMDSDGNKELVSTPKLALEESVITTEKEK
jgi:hypothetical protein